MGDGGRKEVCVYLHVWLTWIRREVGGGIKRRKEEGRKGGKET